MLRGNRKFKTLISVPRVLVYGLIGGYNDICGKNVVNKNIDYYSSGKTNDISIIFSTSKGIFIFDKKRNLSKQILKGHSYGITRSKNFWFAQRTTNRVKGISKGRRVSNIIKFKINNYFINNLSVAVLGLRGEIHQIDFIGDKLYVPYTNYGLILNYDLNRKLYKRITDLFSDKKQFALIEPSHLNSVYSDKRYIYLIAHNYTSKTNRSSDLIVYDERNGDVKIFSLNAHSAHNVIKINGSLFFCDSNNGKLYRNNKIIFSSNKLLRGLSLTNEMIFVGGSDIDFVGDKRFSSDISIYLLNKKGNQVGQLDFPSLGNIYEIRQLNGVDYSLSNWENYINK